MREIVSSFLKQKGVNLMEGVNSVHSGPSKRKEITNRLNHQDDGSDWLSDRCNHTTHYSQGSVLTYNLKLGNVF